MRKLLIGVLAGALVQVGVALTVPLMQANAVAPAPVHGTVVPTRPRMGVPKVMTGVINGGDQVGDYIVVGGQFTSVTLADGSIVPRTNLMAYHVDTGALLTTFNPVLDGTVSVVEAGDEPGTVYVGGKFKNINGVRRTRLAKLDLMTGQVVTSFTANASAEVKTLARHGSRLFIGGHFTAVNGQVRNRLAEVNASTGVLNANFTVGVTGTRTWGCIREGWCTSISGSIVRAVRVTPDGSTLMVVHRGDLVGGLKRWGAAKIDISGATPVVTGWHSDLWEPDNIVGTQIVSIFEADLSPDGSYIAFSTNLGNTPPIHDSVTALPVAGDGLVTPLWVTQNFDSSYGLAISDTAVYIGGHFCWTEGPLSVGGPMYWPGDYGSQYSCTLTSGSVFQPLTVARYHLAALDPATGTALPWNPGSNNSNNGVNFLRTVPRGLLLGHDGTRVYQRLVGRAAFFDLNNP